MYWMKKTAIASVAALSLATIAMSSPALAFGGHDAWNHGGGWHGAAVGAGIGFAAGAVAGAAYASPYYDEGGYCDPYYGCGYGPGPSTGYVEDFGPQYPLAPNYPYYSTGGNAGGANFPP